MNAEQFQLLLQDLATAADLSDPSLLLEHCRIRIGDIDLVLEHLPDFDPDVLHVRLHMGRFEEEHRTAVTTALLESNFISGYGGMLRLQPPAANHRSRPDHARVLASGDERARPVAVAVGHRASRRCDVGEVHGSRCCGAGHAFA